MDFFQLKVILDSLNLYYLFNHSIAINTLKASLSVINFQICIADFIASFEGVCLVIIRKLPPLSYGLFWV